MKYSLLLHKLVTFPVWVIQMDGCDVREAVSCRVFGCFVMLNETQQDSKFNVIDLIWNWNFHHSG